MSEVLDQSTLNDQLPAEPITAVGVVASQTKAPEGFHVVAQTTDGCDADLWKDGLFKSKVTRFLCFSRKNGPDVVADMKVIDIKDKVPQGFTPVHQTMDTKETAMKKRMLCVKISPPAATQTAVYDIQIIAKTKYHLVNYICIGEVNNMGIWYRMGDVVQPECSSPGQTNTAANDIQPIPERRRTTSRSDYENQSGGSYAMTALDDVPFVVSEKFYEVPHKMQQVNLMGITIKSLAEIEEEFQYNFSTERSVAL